jgi:hypothetical protein
MGKNQTLAPIKKQYVKALIAQGDPRSYNEIQADLELELWEQRFKGTHEVKSALEDMATIVNNELESAKAQ